MKKNLPIEFNYDSQNVRTLKIENQPYFVAKDVCDVLGYSDVSMTLQKLDDDENLVQRIFVSGQNREMYLVNQSGLYALILRSNKPEAKKFRKWITAEVIPSLMKEGTYTMPGKTKALPPERKIHLYSVRFFIVGFDFYTTGKEYNLFNCKNPQNYKADLDDLLQARQILDNKIRSLGY